LTTATTATRPRTCRDKIIPMVKLPIEHNESILQERRSPAEQYLVKRSQWIIGGDGASYDIGYGGLDHVIASGKTSTSSFSIPRFTPTPAVRLQRLLLWVPLLSLPHAGKRVRKKDLGLDGFDLWLRLCSSDCNGCRLHAQTLEGYPRS
jgi:pyruvate-ferredoxin/flavodoxin oxidoreductase